MAHLRAPAVVSLGLVALFSFALYLLTMPPGLTWWYGAADSGDLAAAAYGLGIPHPTGYPLFIALGWLATRVPLGEPALRLNVLDAALAAGAVAAAGATVTEACRPRIGATAAAVAGALAALALGTSGLFWSQAIITETYALSMLLCALLGWLTMQAANGRPKPLTLGLVAGLALANHLTAVFAVAAVAVAVASLGRQRSRRELGRLAAGLLFGLSFYVLLPLRAAMAPASNWGDPSSPGRFLRHVTGGGYGGYLAWRDVGGNLRELVGLLRLLLGDVSLWALPAAVAGVLWAWRAARSLAVFAIVLGGLSALFAAAYRVPNHAIYLLPAYLAYTLLAGAGVAAAWEAVRALEPAQARRFAALGAVIVVTANGIGTAQTFTAHDLRGDRTPNTFAGAVLMPLPLGAELRVARDDAAFTLRYAQQVDGIRPDVHVVDTRTPAPAP
jgi:hypothetical protein